MSLALGRSGRDRKAPKKPPQSSNNGRPVGAKNRLANVLICKSDDGMHYLEIPQTSY